MAVTEINYAIAQQLLSIGLDVWTSIEMVGGKDIYLAVLLEFCENAKNRMCRIEEDLKNEDYKDLHIQVHALKNVTSMIGAGTLSAQAKETETALKELHVDQIRLDIPILLANYQLLYDNLTRILDCASQESA